jgi:hypothetical protein
MQWITVGTPSFSIEQVDAVLAQVGERKNPGVPPRSEPARLNLRAPPRAAMSICGP